eukprot:CAMPEP_0194059000 /NCGR_PEP_ID=MMETSP0009_2-20130614/67864_1 /TAXON_ID=210454 /ORGANISM="Grammatophora oceanica, Strain CCMP 410" /LENGTH=38 /DNA_ID= /DNA_START= /DNA_END= /DNA_ORIENTATION=
MMMTKEIAWLGWVQADTTFGPPPEADLSPTRPLNNQCL